MQLSPLNKASEKKFYSQILSTISIALIATGFVSCTKKPVDEPPLTLHQISPERIKGFDPILADDLYADTEVHRIYENLFQYHYLKRPYQLVPNLAEAMPEISKDGTTYTIKLKKGVLFQDDPCFKETQGKGREMTAEDVVYSWKRLADPKLLSSGWWVLDGKIVGLNEWHDAATKSGTADYSQSVEGLKALDRYTLQIKLKSRSSQFIYSLAMSFTVVVPKEAVEVYGKEFLNHPVGTGPFKLREYNPASKIVYDKNPTYRVETYPSEGEPSDKDNGLLDDAGKRLPLSDRIVVEVIVEDQPAWLKFMNGELDAAGIPKDNFNQAITGDGKELKPEMKSRGIILRINPQLDITHDSFNMADPLVGKNKLLRQAISTAVNPGPMISLFYNDRAIAAMGPIPPGMAGYDADLKNPYREFSIEKAKALLAKAGFPDGKGLPPLEYQTVSSSTSRQMNEYFAKQMSAIGVQIKFNTYSWPEFQQKVKNRQGQMWGFAWSADYPDAENFLQLFYSKNASPGPNDSNYSNPEYDKMYEASLKMTDSPERTELYKKMAKIVVEDTPWVFGVHRLAYSLRHPWLKNSKYTEFGANQSKYLRIDPSLKKK